MVDWTYPGLGLSTDRGFDCLAQRLASAALVVAGHSGFPSRRSGPLARHDITRFALLVSSFTTVYPVNMDAEGPLSSLSYSGVQANPGIS